MDIKYWTKNAENPEWILRCYMEATDYAYRHYDLGMLDIDFDYMPEDERLDGAAEAILSEHPEEVLKEYEKDMAAFLDGFFNMPANGKYRSCVNEGKVTDLSEKKGFSALFVRADSHMAKNFIEKGGRAWDGILDGCPLRFIKDWNGGITLIQTTSDSEHKRIYKAYIKKDEPLQPDEKTGAVPAVLKTSTPKLFMLCHCACEIPIGE
jgi:hypothetical protein